MKTVDIERYLLEAERAGLKDVSSQDPFTQEVDTLRGHLSNFGKPAPELGNIQVLEIEVDADEHISLAHGLDAAQFFQIVPEGSTHVDSSVEFRDQDGKSVTPALCVRVDTSHDGDNSFNYIVSGTHVFEVATERPSTKNSTDGKTPSHVIYDTIPLSRSVFYDGWTRTSPIEVKVLSEQDQDKFMKFIGEGATHIAETRSPATGRHRKQ